ncbi:M14 family metallopeptidase [Paucibacter sp. APW11]|uniref:M14 family metallopeptidase n=1 Tax=Roseateles aquae TaxID=3077235 RepID=A0ABU3PD95_9BURK|nr:M14 family metallopeptidase [Paucibacter sp. APW11]MDT9000578.1 M14 family metallopeptidase [Paucibacter sp. APW11]
MKPAAHFSQRYAEARQRWLAIVEQLGLDAEPHWHPLLGRDGERLALDVLRQGKPQADKLLIISSGCHGVEGFCGSAIQHALLCDADWNAAVREAQQQGVAVLTLHALNPHGFSWWRRVTQEGVDLNRNFVDFHAPLPANPGYEALAGALVPAHWPPSDADQAQLRAYAQAHGEAALQAAITGGQYSHELGLFYGGHAPTWSQQTLRQLLREHGHAARQIAWLDLHTGLGPSGVGERIFTGRNEAAAITRARAWWGEGLTTLFDGSSSSAPLQGLMWHAVYQECPRADYTGIALEFGTVPLAEMIDALRADHWLEAHPEAPPALAAAIKRQIRDAFYTDTDTWKTQILQQGKAAALQGLRGLQAEAL